MSAEAATLSSGRGASRPAADDHEARPDRAPSSVPLTADELFDLFEELRAAGFRIDASHLAAAQKLVLDMLARERRAPAERLRTLLAPVFAKTPEQQADFYRRFEAWLNRAGRRPVVVGPVSPAVKAGQTAEVMRRARRWPVIATLAAALLALGLAVGYWQVSSAPEEAETAEQPRLQGGGEAPSLHSRVPPPRWNAAMWARRRSTAAIPEPALPEAAPDAEARTEKLIDEPRPLAVAGQVVLPLLPLAGYGGWLFLRWRRRQLWLERRRTGESADVGRLRINASFDRLFTSPAFRRGAQDLRRRHHSATLHLDVDRTVMATAARAGLFEPVYERRPQAPEYLFLIEQGSAHDHVARLFDEAVERLKDEGVFIDRYYFSGDPRLCYRDDRARTPVTLRELAARRQDHRLIVVGTADGFFHPLTGKLESWLEQFEDWPSRAVMSTRWHPLDRWSLEEIELLEQGFSLATATPRGVRAVAEHAALPAEEQKPALLDGYPPPGLARRRLGREQLTKRAEDVRAGAVPGLDVDPRRSWAILLGVTRVASDPEHFPALPAVANNLRDLAAALADPTVLGLPVERIEVVKDPTRARIAEALGRAGSQAEDTLILYYAGHGLEGSEGRYISTADSTLKEADRGGLFVEELSGALGRLPARHKVLIIDRILTGSMLEWRGRATGLTGPLLPLPHPATHDRGGQIYTLDFALDISSMAGLAPNAAGSAHTVFTQELLALLRDGSGGAGDALTLEDIARDLDARLPRYDRHSARLSASAAGGIGSFRLVHNRAHPSGEQRAADVFIAADRRERHRVELIARKLAELGVPVWSDGDIPLGSGFRDEYERRMDSAKAILVCWTGAAASSGWVRSAAGIARGRNNMVPCVLDEAGAPEPYQGLRAADLTDWDGADDHPGWRAALEGIGRLTDRPDLVVGEARRAVQVRTNSAVKPGAQLHVLAIGVGEYHEATAKHLRLAFADKDAHDVASALLNTQESLYARVNLQVLLNGEATRAGIFRALAILREQMRPEFDDLAVIYFSGHGALVDGALYLLPHEVDARSAVGIKASAFGIGDLRAELHRLAERGRVLVLLDACPSGAATLGGEAMAMDAALLRTALAATNVSVLTSSSGSEPSREDPRWNNGAFTEVFLEALSEADTDRNGVISMTGLTHYLTTHVPRLTEGRQTPGVEVRFEGTIFAAGL